MTEVPEEYRFHLAIGSRFENIELVQVVLRDCLERLGLEEDSRHWVDLAVREALANAIKHGNEQNPSKQVHVDLVVKDEHLVIRIEDEGVGFDLGQVANPLDPDRILDTHGRGILFMKKFMDDIQYGSGPTGGTTVTLRKRIPGPKAESSQDQEEGTE